MEFQETESRTDRCVPPYEFKLPIAAGKTIDEAVAAAPTKDVDGKWGVARHLRMSLQKWRSAI